MGAAQHSIDGGKDRGAGSRGYAAASLKPDLEKASSWDSSSSLSEMNEDVLWADEVLGAADIGFDTALTCR